MGTPKQESVAVFVGEHHIFHAGGSGDADPLGGAEIGRIELPVQIIVNVDRCGSIVWAIGIGIGARPTDFLSRKAHGPPMDEHAEPGIPPPGQPGIILVRRLRGTRLGDHSCEAQNREDYRFYFNHNNSLNMGI